jgi:type IV secretion system protein VirB10
MKDTDALLSPDAAPGNVRRTNNVPILIVIAIAMVVIAVLVWTGAERQDVQDRRNQEIEKGTERKGKGMSAASMATDIVGNMRGGFVPPDAPEAPPTPEDVPAPDGGQAPADSGTPSVPVTRGTNGPPPAPPRPLDNVDRAFQRSKDAQIAAFQKAVTAETAKPVPASGSNRSAARAAPAPADQLAQIQAARQRLANSQAADPGQAFMARLAQLKTMAGAAGGQGSAGNDALSGQAAIAASNRAARSDVAQFDKQGNADRWELNSERKGPPTPYTFSAGAGVIPGRLDRGINSELPGAVSAVVTRNIYDSATGRHLLIPQGTKVTGQYSSQVVFGQAAVLTGWQRFIFPDGSTLDIGSMPGADASGYSGFRDLVDNHYLRIYGSAILMSGIVAGVTMSQPQSNNNSNNNNRTSASDAMSEALGQQLGQVSAQQISRNLNIAPTLEIRPGYDINIIPTKDLVFSRPYKSFDY